MQKILLLIPVLFAAFIPAAGAQDAGAGDRALDHLARRFWRIEMRAHPGWATNLGVPGGDHRLGDLTPEGIAAHRLDLQGLREEVKRIRPETLSGPYRVTQELLLHELSSEIGAETCRGELWRVDQMWGPQVRLLSLPQTQRVDTPERARDYLRRLEAIGTHLDQQIASLRRGLALELVAPSVVVERVVRQVEEILATPLAESPLLGVMDDLPEGWRERRRTLYRERILRLLEEEVRPAFARYLAFLREELRPRARAEVGLSGLPGGQRCYQSLIRRNTTLDLEPLAIHRVGLREMEGIHREMRAITGHLFPGTELEEALDRLRADPGHAFETRAEVLAKARRAVDRAWEALPRAFHHRPETPVRVVRMEAHAEKDAPMAYYRGPSADGARPGTYYVNTYQPSTRPRYTAEVLAFHEAVPGHHLQIALARELESVPEFQKHSGPTAFVEGWALYSERVADEMGLYSGDLDRLGMLSFEAWRAGRLVVDTGLHALGWSRAEAIAYLLENTAASLADIENEVDRYINIPGQALAYKIGQLEIMDLRREAEDILGPAFDLREFHHRVLRHGAVPLPTLRREIQAWIRETRRAVERGGTLPRG